MPQGRFGSCGWGETKPFPVCIPMFTMPAALVKTQAQAITPLTFPSLVTSPSASMVVPPAPGREPF